MSARDRLARDIARMFDHSGDYIGVVRIAPVVDRDDVAPLWVLVLAVLAMAVLFASLLVSL